MEVREVQGGLGIYEKGMPQAPKRDAVKLTHRKSVKAFRELGEQALNAMDYERTRHLPVGRGRLACDRETGEFDPDAIRLPYDISRSNPYPRHVHSTITDGEFLLVHDEDEHQLALASRKWSDKPLERKKRFTLTPEDQMQNMKGELLAERARGLQMEKKLDEFLMGGTPDHQDRASILEIQLAEQKRETEDLKARMEMILAKISGTSVVEKDEDESEEDETESEVVTPASRRKR